MDKLIKAHKITMHKWNSLELRERKVITWIAQIEIYILSRTRLFLNAWDNKSFSKYPKFILQ